MLPANSRPRASAREGETRQGEIESHPGQNAFDTASTSPGPCVWAGTPRPASMPSDRVCAATAPVACRGEKRPELGRSSGEFGSSVFTNAFSIPDRRDESTATRTTMQAAVDNFPEAGKKSGAARAKRLTPAERSAIARKAAEDRWAKKGKTPALTGSAGRPIQAAPTCPCFCLHTTSSPLFPRSWKRRFRSRSSTSPRRGRRRTGSTALDIRGAYRLGSQLVGFGHKATVLLAQSSLGPLLQLPIEGFRTLPLGRGNVALAGVYRTHAAHSTDIGCRMFPVYENRGLIGSSPVRQSEPQPTWGQACRQHWPGRTRGATSRTRAAPPRGRRNLF